MHQCLNKRVNAWPSGKTSPSMSLPEPTWEAFGRLEEIINLHETLMLLHTESNLWSIKVSIINSD